MAWITLGAPGTEYGPCLQACEHRDCKAAREQAVQTCLLCGFELGYETPITQDSEGKLAHRDCVWKEQ